MSTLTSPVAWVCSHHEVPASNEYRFRLSRPRKPGPAHGPGLGKLVRDLRRSLWLGLHVPWLGPDEDARERLSRRALPNLYRTASDLRRFAGRIPAPLSARRALPGGALGTGRRQGAVL